jgi:hypothetical protein
MPAAQGVDPDGTTGPRAGRAGASPVLSAIDRLDEIQGVSRNAAGEIIAEIGLDMTRFPALSHRASWTKLTRGLSGPVPAAAPARSARAIPTSGASWARPLSAVKA